MKGFAKNAARSVALVGIMAATVECSKLALSSIPNVEIVTLLLAVYGYVFGTLGVISAFIFVFIEPLVWGFGSWFVTYLIYWPLVAAVFMLLGRRGVKNRLLLASLAVLLTVFFGALSSAVDVGLFTGFFENFFRRFAVYYIGGISFYLAQILTNVFTFSLLFPTLSRFLFKIKGHN